MYLIYATEQEAWDRSEQEGVRIGLAYHTHCCGSRYVTDTEASNLSARVNTLMTALGCNTY